jgi:nitrate reductase gamma subunit
MNEFFFIVFPYIALTLFFVVPIIRRHFGGFAWTTRASGFFERPAMGIAALAIHWGLIVLVTGHLFGLIGGLAVKAGWVDLFHWIGLAGGVAVFYGFCLALIRRIVVPEMRAVSQVDDYLVLCLLIAIVSAGLYPVIADKSFGLSYAVAPWVRDIFTLSPEVGGMAGLALISKIHVILAFAFLAYFPFTKMVHMWTLPLGYLARPYQTMRSYRRAMM